MDLGLSKKQLAETVGLRPEALYKARRAGAEVIVSRDFAGGMRFASAMVRPHAVNFMDQMLLSDERLRLEQVNVPPHALPQTVAQLLPKSPDYLLLATHENGTWVFNPGDDHVVGPGTALVFMAGPQGRKVVEALLTR